MNRKRLFLSSIILLSSCNLINSFDYIQTGKNLIFGFDDFQVTDEFYSNQPFSFAKVRFGSGPPIIITLAEVMDNKLLWVSSDKSFLYTDDGRVVQTIGLTKDFKIISTEDSSKLLFLYENPYGVFRAFKETRMLSDVLLYSYLGNEIEVNKVIEKITIPELNLIYEDIFLYSNDRLIYSEQLLNPYLKPIIIEFYFK